MNLLDALQPLRRKLPLLITSLLFVVVAAASWSAYHQLERALMLATGDRVTSATQRLASLLDEQMYRGRREEQRIAALGAVVRYAASEGATGSEEARAALEDELIARVQGPTSISIMSATGAPLLSVGRTRPAPVVPPAAMATPA